MPSPSGFTGHSGHVTLALAYTKLPIGGSPQSWHPCDLHRNMGHGYQYRPCLSKSRYGSKQQHRSRFYTGHEWQEENRYQPIPYRISFLITASYHSKEPFCVSFLSNFTMMYCSSYWHMITQCYKLLGGQVNASVRPDFAFHEFLVPTLVTWHQRACGCFRKARGTMKNQDGPRVTFAFLEIWRGGVVYASGRPAGW